MRDRSLLSRRSVTTGLALCPLLAALPQIRPAQPDLEAVLRGRDLPFAPARLDIIRFAEGRKQGLHVMEAVVRLTWAPGIRHHKFVAQDASAEQALKTLVAEIFSTFERLG